MPKFRKKPVVIEAVQVPLTSGGEDLIAWGRLGAWMGDGCNWQVNDSNGLDIETLEGVMTASPGDWVIRGVKGEFYPCRDDIFRMTYEPADEATS